MDWPSVSIVIPAWREESVIGGTLDAMLGMGYDGVVDVIVVAGGSETIDVVERHPLGRSFPLRVIQQKPDGGKNQALLDGLAVAGGVVVVLMDADIMMQADSIRELVRPIVDGRLDLAMGNVFPVRDGFVSRFLVVANQFLVEQDGVKSIVGNAGIAFFNRLPSEKLGEYFDVNVVRACDWGFVRRFIDDGGRVGFSRSAVFRTCLPANIGELIRTQRRWDDASLPHELEMYGHFSRAYYLLVALMASSLVIPVLNLFPIAFFILLGTRRFMEFRRIFRCRDYLREYYSLGTFMDWLALHVVESFVSSYSYLRYMLGFRTECVDVHFKGPR